MRSSVEPTAPRPGLSHRRVPDKPYAKGALALSQQCPRHVLCPGGNNPSLSPAAEGRGASVAGPDFFRPPEAPAPRHQCRRHVRGISRAAGNRRVRFRAAHLRHSDHSVSSSTSVCGRLCCKSLFAPLIANFSGCRGGFRVNMWGTSSLADKLTGDFGNEPDATSISDRGLFRLLAGNLSPGVFRLLQHNRHFYAVPAAPINVRSWGENELNADTPQRPNLTPTRHGAN